MAEYFELDDPATHAELVHARPAPPPQQEENATRVALMGRPGEATARRTRCRLRFVLVAGLGLCLGMTAASLAWRHPHHNVRNPGVFPQRWNAQPLDAHSRWPPKGERQSLHISTDRPAYEPGDTVHAVCWLLGALNQEPHANNASEEEGAATATFQVTVKGPMGDTVGTFQVEHDRSNATVVAAWRVPDEAAGGEYKMVMKPMWSWNPRRTLVAAPAERGFQVHVQRKKGLLLQLDFDREGYGPGETAQAKLSAKRLSGEPVGEEATVDITARINGMTVFQREGLHFAPGHVGELQVQVPLPTELGSKAEGTLGATVKDGAVVETVSAALPLASQDVHVDVLPEGGDLVDGLLSRVYVSARLPNGEPSDIVASVVPKPAAGSSAKCGEQQAVATVRTVHEGRGVSSAFVPAAGTSYQLCVLRPQLRLDRALKDLPKSIQDGATLSATRTSFRATEALSFSIQATEAGLYVLRVYRREQELGQRQLNITAPREAHNVSLQVASSSAADGVLRATLYHAVGRPRRELPLAERLVWREPAEVLGLEVSAAPKRVEPGARVTLSVRSSTPRASVSVAVVDARGRAALPRRRRPFGLPEMAYLEDEVVELTDADAYLSREPASPAVAQRLDLLLGVQGWRRFIYEDAPFFLDSGRAKGAPPSAEAPPSEERRLRLLALGAPHHDLMFKGAVAAGAEEDEEAMPMMPMFARAANAAIMRRGAIMRKGAKVRAMPLREAPAAARVEKKRQFKAPTWKKGSEPGLQANSSELLFWTGTGRTDGKGLAVFTFNAPEVSASFEVLVDGVARGGRLGASRGVASVTVGSSLAVQPKLPAELTGGDRVWAPIAVELAEDATAEAEAQAKLLISTSGGLALQGVGTGGEDIPEQQRHVRASKERASSPLNFTVSVRPGSSRRVYAHLEALGSASNGSLTVQASLVPQLTAAPRSAATQQLHIAPRGFPQKLGKGGMLSTGQPRASLAVPMPPDAVAGSTAVHVQLYLSPASRLDSALEALLREPCGCFEQTSSTTYPLVMALQYFLAHPELSSTLRSRARDILGRGYKRLVSFQTKSGGFEWFGDEPAHEALTAYGVLQFHDMKSAVPDLVDDGMLGRAFDWLFTRRAGESASSAFLRSERALDSFGRAPVVTTDAYIVYAMVKAGHGSKLELEIKILLAACDPSNFQDPYVLSLAAGTLFHLGQAEQATALAKRVAALQAADGHVEGAKGSITSSRGNALAVEATAVSLLAWLDDPAKTFAANAEAAIRWLAGRCEHGRFGSTQATVLALKAIIAYEKWRASMTQWQGTVALLVDGETQAVMDLSQQNAAEPALLSAAAANSALEHAGNHSLEVVLRPAAGAGSLSEGMLPFAMDVAWSSPVPPSSATCAVKVETTLSGHNFSEGALGELTVNVEAVSDENLPMVVAIVGVPAGLEVEDEALRLLKAQGSVDFMERHGAAELVFYWRGFKRKSTKRLVVPFVAAVPGDYLGRASRAYLYYGDELKSWAPGLRARVTSEVGA